MNVYDGIDRQLESSDNLILLLLALSAAFDTIVYDILLVRLEDRFDALL